MSNLAELLRTLLSESSWLALPLAVLGGVVTGLNPCCLPLYPAAAATCCATREEKLELALSNALAFIFGIALATSALGVTAALAGRVLVGVSGLGVYAIALVPLIMGLHLLEWIRLPLPRAVHTKYRAGAWGAFSMGLLVWLVLAPCGTPILAAVLSYAAYEGSVSYGGFLLFSYGLGAGLPLVVVGLAAGRLGSRLELSGWGTWVNRITGIALLVFGFYLLWIA